MVQARSSSSNGGTACSVTPGMRPRSLPAALVRSIDRLHDDRLLGGQLGIHLVARHDQVIQPRRELCERGREFRCLEDQQCADHLHPRGAGLGPGADDDVAVPATGSRATGRCPRLGIGSETGCWPPGEPSREPASACGKPSPPRSLKTASSPVSTSPLSERELARPGPRMLTLAGTPAGSELRQPGAGGSAQGQERPSPRVRSPSPSIMIS